MSDQIYKGILTPIGIQAILLAISDGQSLNLSYIGIGDGDGDIYTPVEGQEDLKNELHQISINDLFIDPANPSWVVIEGYIPEDIGGFWIRELSAKDENGRVIAVASYPPTYKPLLVEGASKAEVVRMVLEVSNTDVFNLVIDTSLALVTRDEFTRHTAMVTGVHGSSAEAMPDSLAARYDGGRLKVGVPVEPEDAARLREITDVIALIDQATDSGVPLWTTHTGDGTTTRFNFMGLLRDNANAVAVFINGVKLIGGEDYTIDLSQTVSAVIFTTPPAAGVKIEFLTMVYISQIPLATTVTSGVVLLADHLNFGSSLSNSVVTRQFLSGDALKLESANRMAWRLEMSGVSSLKIENQSNINVMDGSEISLSDGSKIETGSGAELKLSGSKVTINGTGDNTDMIFNNRARIEMSGTARHRMTANSEIQANNNAKVNMSGDSSLEMGLASSIAMSGNSKINLVNAVITDDSRGALKGVNGIYPTTPTTGTVSLDGSQRIFSIQGMVSLGNVPNANKPNLRAGDIFYFIGNPGSSLMFQNTAGSAGAGYISVNVAPGQVLALMFTGNYQTGSTMPNPSEIPIFLRVI